MFWEIFSTLCAKKGSSANAIAKEIGISSGSVTKWKNGTMPNNKTLKSIATYFNVTIEYLCGKEEKPTGENTGELSEQEKILLNTFRRSSEEAKQRIIQSVLNIHDEFEKKNQATDTANAG